MLFLCDKISKSYLFYIMIGDYEMREFEGYKKGVNLGGWLSQCGDNYNDEHYMSFIQEKDIETIAGWGCDHVRVPVDYNVIQTDAGEIIESGFKYIDSCIEWCKKYNLKMVFDLHKACGYVFDDENYIGFFEQETLQNQFIELWKEIIRRYGKYSDMIAFELLNEVTELRFAEIWNDISKRTIKAIREINKDVKIIVGGVFNSSIFGLTLLEKPYDENVVYTFHCYSPFMFTHQNAGWVAKMPKGYSIEYPVTIEKLKAESNKVFGTDFDDEFVGYENEMISDKFFDRLMKKAIDKAEEFNCPLYCGEYGVIDQTKPEYALLWYKDIHSSLEKFNIARSAWTYKNMDFGLSDERMDVVREELIKYL